MDEAKFIRLNTVFLPDDRLNSLVLELAEQITRGKDEIFHIDNQKYFAHLTIYAPEYPLKNYYHILSVVDDFAKNFRPTQLIFDSFYVGWRYVGIIFKKTAEIEHLHETLLESLNPLREGRVRDSYQSEIAAGKFSPDQVTNIANYGYHNVLLAFEPHLTLARFTNETDALELAKKLNQTIKIPLTETSKLGVCEMGPNGTCTKIVQEFLFTPDSTGQPLR